MSEQKKIIGATLSGLVALGALTAGAANAGVPDQPTHWEKCAGIAKAGQNDCGALACGCHGTTGVRGFYDCRTIHILLWNNT